MGKVSTAEREYVALHHTAHIRLYDQLLYPTPVQAAASTASAASTSASAGSSSLLRRSEWEGLSEGFREYLRRTLNEDQYAAVRDASARRIDEHRWVMHNLSAYTVQSIVLSVVITRIAVCRCTQHIRFTLLQGPPGTGKTQTIVALLNVLHVTRYQQHYESAVRYYAEPVYYRV